MTAPDIAVVGLGPAGRALAHRAAANGLRVAAFDPAPERVWEQTLGGWEHQLPAWIAPEATRTRAAPVVLRTPDQRTLAWSYVVLDAPVLQDSLTLDRVEVHRETVRDLSGLAPVVVDCRGSVPAGVNGPDVPLQTAYGLVLHRPDLLGGVGAVLMDWRPYDGRTRWGHEPVSFCYIIPLPGGGLLVEETSLAASPPMPTEELQRRLRIRLTRAGVTATEMDAAPAETVHIPMLPDDGARPHPRFGAAGTDLNPVSGYSVFASLQRVDAVLEHLVTHGTVPAAPPGTDRLRRVALQALVRLPADACVALFDGFARLSPRDQWSVLDPQASAPALAAALTRQWAGMPVRYKASLIRATIGLAS